MQVRIGDTVRLGHGLAGRVEEVLTKGSTIDPLTVEEIDGTPDDPALLIVTPDGVKTAILRSEVREHVPGGSDEVKTGAAVTWADGDGSALYGKVARISDGDEMKAAVAHVNVWRPDGSGGWAPTEEEAEVKAAALEVLPAIVRDEASAQSNLLDLYVAAEAAAEAKGLPRDAVPTGRAVQVVYRRGLSAWPGDTVTSLPPDAWALGRVKAFLAVAVSGQDVERYSRDADLLPRLPAAV